MSTSSDPQVTCVTEDDFLQDVIDGLSKAAGQRHIPSRYLYDERGCELFEAICETPEYYPTRTEIGIMRRDARVMADVCGSHCRLVEFGSGASIKTQLLLDELESPESYIPVDIAPEYLIPSTRQLKDRYPELRIDPICANFTEPFDLPPADEDQRTIVYFPGSTIGNFTRPESVRLVTNMQEMAGPGGGILIGMDLKKDTGILEAAYNDSRGITAQFTRNLLTRLQRELDADLIPEQFEHFARYSTEAGRIEIYLRSTANQTVRIAEHEFEIKQGELINTEYSYKYDLGDVQQIAMDAGTSLTHAWLDESNWFGIFFFSCRS